MIQTIVTEPNSVLRARAEEVDSTEIGKPEFQQLIDDLIETMYAAFGIGIAAPQIDVSKRVIIVETGVGDDQIPVALINPEIVSKSWRKIKSEEGCLSVPGVYGVVRRHRAVEVSALNRDGQPVKVKNSKMVAIILQHEIDHLNGLLFIDKAEEIHPITQYKNLKI